MVQDDEIYHYHLDHLGTPRELTNQQGNIVWKAQYKTYGNVALKEVEEVENNLRFQGQYFDEETGLHYNRHRYYDPSVGQFTTQDPIGLLGGVNNYQYAPNPTGWVDPFGLTCKEIKYSQTKEMAAEYRGEEFGMAKAWSDYGNPEIEYLISEADRADHEVFVKDKKLVDRNGNFLDSGNSNNGKLIFVMDPQGRVFAGEPRLMEFHHSSLLAGEPVAAAGELMVVDGMVVSHSRQSGHYKPDQIHHDQFKDEMKSRGLDLSVVNEDKIS